MKTIQDYDNELEELGKQHAATWGAIQQLRAERNFALQQHARQNARSEPAHAVQLSRSNDHGFNNDKNVEYQEIFRG